MKIKSIRDVKISTKLLLGVISILGMFILGKESILTAYQIDQVGAELNDVWMNAVIVAEELNTTTSDYRIQESRHAITTNPELMASLEEELQVLEQEIDRKFQHYRSLQTREKDQEIIREAEQVWREYLACSEILIETSKGNDRTKATNLMMGESQELFDRASGLFLEAVECTKQETAEERERAGDLYERLNHMKIFLIAAVTVIVIALITYLIRAIREPSDELVEAARRATNGNLDIQLDYQSSDELGVLTEAMNLLIQRLKDIISDEIYLFQEIGGKNLDVRSRCEQAYRGDFAPILYAVSSLQSRLKETKRQQEEEVNRRQEEIDRLTQEISELKEKLGQPEQADR